MSVHNFYPSHYTLTIGAHDPVLRIADGDPVLTTTVDSRGRDSRGVQVTQGGNPMTGPFYVQGAEPGDVLAVHFDSMAPNRDTGYSGTVVAPGVVDPGYVRELPTAELAEWRIDRVAGTAMLVSPATRLGPITLPLAPMLGCFGVAPEKGQTLSTATSGPYGGNMDYRGFTVGVTAYLPVFVPGALFFLGDGHAAQGDGEIVGTGVETSFEVQFSVRVMKGRSIAWPRGESAEWIFTVGNARPLDQAVQHATTEMLRWLQEEYGLDGRGAGTLLGHCVHYDLGNMFDPAYTMVCKVSKRVLGSIQR